MGCLPGHAPGTTTLPPPLPRLSLFPHLSLGQLDGGPPWWMDSLFYLTTVSRTLYIWMVAWTAALWWCGGLLDNSHHFTSHSYFLPVTFAPHTFVDFTTLSSTLSGLPVAKSFVVHFPIVLHTAHSSPLIHTFFFSTAFVRAFLLACRLPTCSRSPLWFGRSPLLCCAARFGTTAGHAALVCGHDVYLCPRTHSLPLYVSTDACQLQHLDTRLGRHTCDTAPS